MDQNNMHMVRNDRLDHYVPMLLRSKSTLKSVLCVYVYVFLTYMYFQLQIYERRIQKQLQTCIVIYKEYKTMGFSKNTPFQTTFITLIILLITDKFLVESNTDTNSICYMLFSVAVREPKRI